MNYLNTTLPVNNIAGDYAGDAHYDSWIINNEIISTTYSNFCWLDQFGNLGFQVMLLSKTLMNPNDLIATAPSWLVGKLNQKLNLPCNYVKNGGGDSLAGWITYYNETGQFKFEHNFHYQSYINFNIFLPYSVLEI